jgi:hypothetical protein
MRLIKRKPSHNLRQIHSNPMLANNSGVLPGLLPTHLHHSKGPEKRLEYQVNVHSHDNLLSVRSQPARFHDIHTDLQYEDSRSQHKDLLLGRRPNHDIQLSD